MNLTFAAQLNKMITAGLGGAVEAPETGVAVGRRVEYTSIGPAPILTFEANSELPLKALSVNMEPIQDLHGQANPYPAGGGKNLAPFVEGINFTILDVTFTTQSGNLYINGTASNGISSASQGFKDNFSTTLTAGSYYFSWNNYPSGSGIVPIINKLSDNTNVLTGEGTFSLSEETTVYIGIYVPSGVSFNGIQKIQVEKGTAATAYAPYSNICPISGRSEVNVWREATYDTSADPALTIPLGQTVYGGSLDVTTGVLTVDRAIVELQNVSAWRKSGTYPGGFFCQRITSSGVYFKGNTPFICSHAKTVTRLQDYVFGTCYCDDAFNFRIMDGSATLSDWTTYLQEQKANGTPVTICATLNNPITITLTPEQLTTVLGTNNVWSDGGDVSATYGNIYYTEGY